MEAVMFTMAHSLKGQAKRDGWMPTKALRLAALLGTLVLASLAVNALTIFAHGSFRLQSIGECSLTAYKAVRTACHDNPFPQPVTQPFRGANAPVLDRAP
jgi:hypothetical protein